MCLGEDVGRDWLHKILKQFNNLAWNCSRKIKRKQNNFEIHIRNPYSNPSQTLGALQRTSNLLRKLETFLFTIVTKYTHTRARARFWIFCSRTLTSSKNYVHKRAFRVVWDGHNSSYFKPIKPKNEPNIHQHIVS